MVKRVEHLFKTVELGDRKMNTRIGVRIPQKLRKQMEKAIRAGKFQNLSDLIREAVEKLLGEVSE